METISIPNTNRIVPLNEQLCGQARIPLFATLHVCMAPFLDVNRVKIGCYQLLNSKNEAIASCCICGGNPEETFAADYVDIASFHAEALKHFEATAPAEIIRRPTDKQAA